MIWLEATTGCEYGCSRSTKLLLRAYNSEADDLVAKLRPFRLEAAIDRLEKALHGRFASRRVNLVNMRREFFYLTPGEVAAALAVGDGPEAVLTEFVEEPEAAEWHMSQNTRRAHDTSSVRVPETRRSDLEEPARA